MKTLIYSILLRQYGVTYLDTIISMDGKVIIYGYNKVTHQYSFWRVVDLCTLHLIEICESKHKAIFSYRILNKGI